MCAVLPQGCNGNPPEYGNGVIEHPATEAGGVFGGKQKRYIQMDRMTKEDRITALEMYDNGFTPEQISQGLRMTLKQVKYIIWYYKGPKKKYRKQIVTEISLQILEMYRNGMKPWLIAKKLDVPVTSVYGISKYQRRKEFDFLRKK